MDLRLFFSTFALVFLAELGDKTQLASMAVSAGSKSPWSVFAGSASALVLSSLIAVVAGSTLQRFVPQYYLKIGAAVLFLGFGVALLVNVIVTKPAAAAPVEQVGAGPLARLVLEAAVQFEKASAGDYAALAASTASPALKSVFEHLAAEEAGHLSNIRSMSKEHGGAVWRTDAGAGPVIEGPQSGGDAVTAVDRAIDHERRTAAFYRQLATAAPLPGVRAALLRFAEEEDSHAEHLVEIRDQGFSRV